MLKYVLRNITKNVANLSPVINTQNVANASYAFPLFSFFAIVTYVLITPSVPVICLRSLVIIHCNLVRTSMFIQWKNR